MIFLLGIFILFFYFYKRTSLPLQSAGLFMGFEFRFLCAINMLNFMSGRPFAFEFSAHYFQLSQLEIESRNDNSAKRFSRMVSCN